MKTVSEFEAKLIRVARAIVSRPNPDHAKAFVKSPLAEPTCLGRDAVDLVKDTLAKGVTLLLAREGWPPDRFLRGGQARFGRLWERTPAAELGLEFSPNTLTLLLRLTAVDFESPTDAAGAPASTVGDALVEMLAYRLFRRTEAERFLHVRCRRNGLCRLFFPEDFPKAGNIDWARWTEGIGSHLVEALERPLALQWLEFETNKRQVASPNQMREFTAGQEIALAGWLDAIDRRQRWDLARFLLRVGSKLLPYGATAQNWIGGLDAKGLTLAVRANLHRSALVFLTHWQRLAEWTARARAVGYLDEEYAAAQLWKADWERFGGDESTRVAEAVLREIEPLKSGKRHMSRAYRIMVDLRLDRVIKASDHVSTELEILEILPCDQTAELLAAELERRGFARHGDKLTRREKGIVIEIDPKTAEVVVRAEGQEKLSLEESANVFADAGQNLSAESRKKTEKELRTSLEKKATAEASKLQQQVSDELEARLLDLQQELNQVVNKVTGESLKRKAAQIGNIKEMSEDAESGALKIVVEV